MQRIGLAWLAFLVVAISTSSPALSDWLVTNKGDRIQTRGAWQVKGKMVVFTNQRGTFSSMPSSEIDLEASRKDSQSNPLLATQAKRSAEKPQPIAVITNKDIRRARTPEPEEVAPSGQHGVAPSVEFADQSQVADIGDAAQGVTWRRINDGNFEGVEVVGTLENDGDGVVTDLGVLVSLRDDHNQVIASQRAVVQARSLMPGTYTKFQARFADLEIEEDEQTRVEVHCQAKRLREKQAENVDVAGAP